MSIQSYCNQSIADGDLMPITQEPNTALLSTLLMFGTFAIAYALRAVKGSHFLGRTVSCMIHFHD